MSLNLINLYSDNKNNEAKFVLDSNFNFKRKYNIFNKNYKLLSTEEKTYLTYFLKTNKIPK